MRGLGAKLCIDFFYFYFANNFDVLKSKRLCFLLNKNINFKKKRDKIENEIFHAQFYKDEGCALARI